MIDEVKVMVPGFVNKVILAGIFAVSLGVMVSAMPAPSFAQQQTLDSLINQISRLQKDIQVLSRQVYKGGKPPAGPAATASPSSSSGGNAYIARVEDRISQLEAETRSNTGNQENLNHTLNQISHRLDKLVNDLNFRLSAIEQRLATVQTAPPGQLAARRQQAPSGPPQISSVPRSQTVDRGATTGGPVFGTQPGSLGTISQKDLNAIKANSGNAGSGAPAQAGSVQAPVQQASAPRGVLPEGTPQEQYRFAYSLIRKAEYDQAATALKEFVDKHPKSGLTANARYWLGETHYVRKDFRQAAEHFLAGYQGEPAGRKAPDNLLKLGMSLAGMDKKVEACKTFDKLSADFPQSTALIKRRLGQQRKKIGCG